MQKTKLFFLFLFVEGGMVMSYELASSRMLQPLFGTGTIIWAFILGITMAGLAYGYKIGSLLCKKNDTERYLSAFSYASSSCCAIIPSVFSMLTPSLYSLPFFVSLFLSSAMILFMPMFLLGTLSPLSVQYHEKKLQTISGISAGNVLFLSTFGGVLFMFLFTFVLLPSFGTFHSVCFLAFVMMISTWALFRNHEKAILHILLVILAILIHRFMGQNHAPNIIKRIENSMGTIELEEYDDGSYRVYVNGILQTEYGKKHERLAYYDTILSLLNNKKKNILIIGLGGGTLAKLLHQKGYKITAIENNPGMIDLARNFFGIPKEISMICDDGRVFINRHAGKIKFDAVIMDAFHGEIVPYHLFTLESLMNLKKMLSDSASTLIINWHGYINGLTGYGTKILINTLNFSGFDVKIHPTAKEEDYRNQILECIYLGKKIQNSNKAVSTDDFPEGEWANALAQLRWRINYYQSNLNKTK
ncbi:MAG: fused MFS/spermidine synthase [Bacteroidia bacterium]|nr:fused MFS/spermidine synthase [Bacteroidia bacterium]